MKLLHIDSSILGGASVSRQLSADIVAAERKRSPQLSVVYRDLAAAPLMHLSGAHLAAAQPGQVEQAEPLRHDLLQGQAALAEFLDAEVIVIGAPMYNFTIPSQLKAWIDRLAVAGKTFRYGEKGPEGLVGGKKVIIASTRGGMYGADTGLAFLDHQETYLRVIFQFFGITDITFIRAEGVAMSEQRGKAIAAAQVSIAALN